jgi:hypothetical protein
MSVFELNRMLKMVPFDRDSGNVYVQKTIVVRSRMEKKIDQVMFDSDYFHQHLCLMDCGNQRETYANVAYDVKSIVAIDKHLTRQFGE